MTDVFNIAQAATEIDTGDTAWMIVATALVLLMTPALGLFYAGLVRGKNALNTFMMCIAAIAIGAVTWAAIGYSFAFDGTGDLIGGFGYALMNDVTFDPREGTTIPHLIFFAFQGTFCIITLALLSGAVVERMRFSAFLLFGALWTVLVYAVLAHWGFGGGWLIEGGTLDFAGGIAVEMASGFSALAAAIVVGARKDWGRQALLPHNSVFVLVGASLLWFGWFGFNGGSGFNTGQNSVLAFTNTLLCPAASLLSWFVMDAIRGRRVTAVGAATAIIVGCVLITPAGGFIAPGWALLLGALGAVPCYAVIVFRSTRVDETLDVLAAHGTAGLVGILFIGFFAQETWNAIDGGDGWLYGNFELFKWQAFAALATPVYAFVMTAVLLKLVGFVIPLRATERDESLGMDVTQHNEEAYATGEGAILVLPDGDGGPMRVPVKDPGLA
ncbi:MAG: ammonium transporter [Actinomycetota bacterium]|nr:ammonium transporter [Actinomycetota bacterium]